MLEIEVVVCSIHSIRRMIMTKSKNGHKGQAHRTNSGDVAATESCSTVAPAEDHGHEAESQPSKESSSDDFNMAVRELAYSKWEAAGFPEGDGFEFWLEAEKEIRAHQPPSTPTPE
jgi:hypothetical protein